ncbi:hypothetical protein ACVNPZ_01850 [Staphylococcus aureus]
MKGIQGNQVILRLNLKHLKQQKHHIIQRDLNLTKHLNMLNIEMLVQVSVNTTMEHLDMKRDQDSISHQKQTHTT